MFARICAASHRTVVVGTNPDSPYIPIDSPFFSWPLSAACWMCSASRQAAPGPAPGSDQLQCPFPENPIRVEETPSAERNHPRPEPFDFSGWGNLFEPRRIEPFAGRSGDREDRFSGVIEFWVFEVMEFEDVRSTRRADGRARHNETPFVVLVLSSRPWQSVEKRGLAPSSTYKLRENRRLRGACPPFSTRC